MALASPTSSTCCSVDDDECSCDGDCDDNDGGCEVMDRIQRSWMV